VDTLVQWMTDLLQLLFGFTSRFGFESYGVAIILLTIIIKMLIYPLTYKQMVSMRKTTEIQPKIKELQAKHKDDPKKANAAIMEMYKEQKVNPMGGCLPLLIQLPIFWALYKTLLNFPYTDPAQAQFLWFNLTQPDTWYILAVLAALTSFLQTKVSNPNATKDSTQKALLYVMPLFMGYISATVPSGLALYWVTMNSVSILQLLYINHRLAKKEAGAKAA